MLKSEEVGTQAAETAGAPNQHVTGDDDMATSKSTRSPAFQYYPKDYLTDANVMAMSYTERGVYWHLISLCWLDGSLPANLPTLARMLSISPAHLGRLWPAISVCFKEKDARLIHPRLERERKSQAEFRRRQSDNGKLGGRPKKGVGSSGLTQPEATKSSSSPISDLQSPSSTAKDVRTTARVSPIASGYRSATNNAHFSPSCGNVPHFLHAEFVGKLIGGGMDDAEADRQVRAFYKAVEEKHAGQIVGDEPLKFWRARFAERAKPLRQHSEASDLIFQTLGITR